MKKLRKRHSGEGYIDVCVLVVCAMLVLALAVRILPVFVAKQQLDTYAVELVREAEISGRVGTETSRRAATLTDSTGLDPNIRWSKTGRMGQRVMSPAKRIRWSGSYILRSASLRTMLKASRIL